MQDPNYHKELEKYDNPIPSREFILTLIKKRKSTHKQLTKLLNLAAEQYKPLTNRLRAMVSDKQLSCNKDGVYRIFSNRGLLTGKIIANPKGFGFIKLDNPDKSGKDLRLSIKQMQNCMHGDRVKARLLNNKLDAEVVSIIMRAKNLVARLEIVGTKIFAIVDDKHIKNKIEIINKHNSYKANQVVVLDVVNSPSSLQPAQGKITSILGEAMSEDMEIQSALIRFEIPDKFSNSALVETKKLPTTVLKKDTKNRKDLTDIPFITIDGADSKDFDDAVFCTTNDAGWKLLVAIADVAHYVVENSALDKEALERGNSVYFPRKVIPMLPEKISNGLCSLNEKVKRLALICEMDIDSTGNIKGYKFYDSIIFSHARLTYDFVNAILAQKKKIKDTKINENIDNLYGVYQSLKIARSKRGVMDFDKVESRIIFNNNGKIKNIVAKERGTSEKIIEECMLAANQSTALFLAANNKIFPYRNHPNPTVEKIVATKKFLSSIGLTLSGGTEPASIDFAKTLKKAKGRTDENIIKTTILRTMKQATYGVENQGHFGLAFADYTHFTSPIRRYSDLMVHRVIKQIIHKKKSKNINNIDTITAHISTTERRADEASRDVEKWLKCEYMQDKIGQTFTGIISSVASFGIFVELEDTFVEGLVLIRDLIDDYYIFDEPSMSLTGKSSGKTYKLGSKIVVMLAGVNLEERQISLVVR